MPPSAARVPITHAAATIRANAETRGDAAAVAAAPAANAIPTVASSAASGAAAGGRRDLHDHGGGGRQRGRRPQPQRTLRHGCAVRMTLRPVSEMSTASKESRPWK